MKFLRLVFAEFSPALPEHTPFSLTTAKANVTSLAVRGPAVTTDKKLILLKSETTIEILPELSAEGIFDMA